MPLPPEKDPLGQALIDYYNGDKSAIINVKCDVTEDDVIPVRQLFRSYKNMSAIEKKALSQCCGKVLDIGGGSGLHSLYLQEKGLEVTAIDISPGSVDTMKKRGVKDVRLSNIFNYKNGNYDTLLMLMNGIGITGNLRQLDQFFNRVKDLMEANGQLLLDSSDIQYLYQEPDGSIWMDLNREYYGEVRYQMEYKGIKSKPFDWLFIDFDTLKKRANKNGLQCEKITEGRHYDYLAKISKAKGA